MRSRRSPFLTFAVLAAVLIALPTSAQTNTWDGNKINGVPASVTSFGFGGRPGFHGMPASVTSLNFGQVPSVGGFRPPHRILDGRHHRTPGLVNPFYGGTYYVPYAYPVYVMPTYDSSGYDSSIDSTPELSDRASDTAGELRGEVESLKSTIRDYRDELRAASQRGPSEVRPEPVEADRNQPQTVLVFKDGHRVEVENYAIVGGTLYDLSQGRSKKVALAELDLPATVKQNDERGVEFRVPATSN